MDGPREMYFRMVDCGGVYGNDGDDYQLKWEVKPVDGKEDFYTIKQSSTKQVNKPWFIGFKTDLTGLQLDYSYNIKDISEAHNYHWNIPGFDKVKTSRMIMVSVQNEKDNTLILPD